MEVWDVALYSEDTLSGEPCISYARYGVPRDGVFEGWADVLKDYPNDIVMVSDEFVYYHWKGVSGL